MFLRDLISDWLRNKKSKEYEELEKILGSLVGNYKKKLVLFGDFLFGRVDDEKFMREFKELLKLEASLEALEETSSHEENLKQEINLLKKNLTEQNNILNQKPIDRNTLSEKIKEEGKILDLQEQEIKKLEYVKDQINNNENIKENFKEKKETSEPFKNQEKLISEEELFLFLEKGNPASFQLDLSYDPNKIKILNFRKEQNVINAGKDFQFNKIQEGLIKLIIFGFNTKIIENGKLLAIKYEMQQGAILEMKNILASDGYGNSIEISLNLKKSYILSK